MEKIQENVNLLPNSFMVNCHFISRDSSEYAPIEVKDNTVKLQFDNYLLIPREKITKKYLNEIGYLI